jgi:hypothetical protein
VDAASGALVRFRRGRCGGEEDQEEEETAGHCWERGQAGGDPARSSMQIRRGVCSS